MESSIIIDTLKAVTSTSTLDTLPVKLVYEESIFTTLTQLAPLISIVGGVFIALLASFLTYIGSLKKDRKIDEEREIRREKIENKERDQRFNSLCSSIIFSCSELVKATEKQKKYSRLRI
ncbi:MAG: hypothetical protein ABIY50_04725 [Ignavibacteria bacterium]